MKCAQNSHMLRKF